MPDRIIRDELYRSRRFIRLTSDTLRVLFIGLILHADDLANAEATTEAISGILRREVNDETTARWLSELADVGLVRIYQVSDGDARDGPKTYVHIPKFRQRLRWHKGRHPLPPAEIESNEIRELRAKVGLKTDSSRTQVGLKSDEVKRSEVKRSEETLARTPARATHPDLPQPKPDPDPKPVTPVLEIGKTIQNLTRAPKPEKTETEIEAERARQLAYVAAKTKDAR